MSDFVNILLPDIIIQIVLGFVCLRVFRITRIVKQSDDYEHLLVETLVIGFILYHLFLLIPFSFGRYVDTLGMVISSGVIGFLYAKLLSSPLINRLRKILNIKHTPFKYAWQNIEDPKYAIYVDATDPETKTRYNGKLIMYEDFERTPLIQLSHYIEWKDGVEINDFSDDKYRTVLIDTSKYSVIKIDYQDCSSFANQWK